MSSMWQNIIQSFVTRMNRRRGPSTIDVDDFRFDVASQVGSCRGKSSHAGEADDMPDLDLVAAAEYISEARKETTTVDWKLKDFLHLNKVYMLDPGPSITVEAGKTIDLATKWKFSLEKIYSTSETRSHIWLVTEIIEAPNNVENVVCKFSTHLSSDGAKVKEINGPPVTIPASHIGQGHHNCDNNNNKFNVACLLPWDCVYSTEKLLAIKIKISLFSLRTEGISDVSNIHETMKRSGDTFSVHIGSLLWEEEEGERFSDVQLRLKDDSVVHAHRAILASRSPVFKAMLLADMTESNSGVINIPDVGAKAMDVILHHIYTGKVDPTCNQIIEDVLYGAEKYNLPELMEYCDKIMITVVDKENALALLKVAKMYRLKHAIRDVTNYIKMNSGEILDIIIDEKK